MSVYRFIFKTILILELFECMKVYADCNVCQTNGAACVNQTSFQLCFGDRKPHTSQTFNCMSGLVCTDLPNICFQSGGWTPSCGDLSKCGICNERNVFACTSRTTFAFCFGSTIATDVLGTCPTGYVCDYSSEEICVPRDKATSIVCDIYAV